MTRPTGLAVAGTGFLHNRATSFPRRAGYGAPMTDAAIDESPRAAAAPVRPAAASVVDYAALHLALIPALLFAAAWFVQHSAFDMAITNAFFDPAASGFGWRPSLLLDILGHQTARSLPSIVGGISLAALAAGYAIPRLRPWRALLFTTGCAMLLGPVLINVMKTLTSEHCPSDIVEFGGIVSYAADRAAPFWEPRPDKAPATACRAAMPAAAMPCSAPISPAGPRVAPPGAGAALPSASLPAFSSASCA